MIFTADMQKGEQMMTLEETIEQFEEVANTYEGMADNSALHSQKLYKSANEYKQFAEWLRELKERRKQPEIIKCKDCKHKGTKNCVANAWATIFGVTVKDDFYCGLAERRTDG